MAALCLSLLCATAMADETPEQTEPPVVTLNKTSLTLAAGDTALLTASVSDGQAVTWTSLTTSVASVDAQGRVIREGEQVLIDTGEAVTYIGLCYKHWKQGKSGLCGNV